MCAPSQMAEGEATPSVPQIVADSIMRLRNKQLWLAWKCLWEWACLVCCLLKSLLT